MFLKSDKLVTSFGGDAFAGIGEGAVNIQRNQLKQHTDTASFSKNQHGWKGVPGDLCKMQKLLPSGNIRNICKNIHSFIVKNKFHLVNSIYGISSAVES